MTHFWCSFNVPGDDGRPLTADPPGVLSFWESGFGGDAEDGDDYVVMVLLAEAEDADTLWATLTDARYWPDVFAFAPPDYTTRVTGWRFCHEKPAGWTPGDRFPQSETP